MELCANSGCYRSVEEWGERCWQHRPVTVEEPKPVHVPDPVNRPNHYKAGGIEAIHVIDAFGLGFNLGNVVKYVLRAGRKDPAKTLEDLKKAESYLKREIVKRETLEST